MDPATLTAISIASTVASTGMGVMSSIQQGKARQAQAEYQADVARQNQQLAEQQASAQRKEGYDNMIAKRQETAKLIGRQRAAAGASGATVDVGSSIWSNAAGTALGGIAQIGSTWGKYQSQNSNGSSGKYWDRALGQYVDKPVRH